MMKKSFDSGLVQAVKEYYQWHGDRSSHPVRFVKDINDYDMLLVRFTDGQGEKMSGLMFYQPWKDGHYEVSEFESVLREYEGEMIAEFQSPKYSIIYEDEFGNILG